MSRARWPVLLALYLGSRLVALTALPMFLDEIIHLTGWPSGYGSRDSMAFLRSERQRHPGGLLLVTPSPSTTASAVRFLAGRDPAVEVRYVDPASVDGARALGGDAPGCR